MTNFKTIGVLLEQSPLRSFEVNDLLLLFCLADDEKLEGVARLLSEDISLAKKLHDNYMQKSSAIQENSDDLWQRIFSEELAELENLQQTA